MSEPKKSSLSRLDKFGKLDYSKLDYGDGIESISDEQAMENEMGRRETTRKCLDGEQYLDLTPESLQLLNLPDWFEHEECQTYIGNGDILGHISLRLYRQRLHLLDLVWASQSHLAVIELSGSSTMVRGITKYYEISAVVKGNPFHLSEGESITITRPKELG